MSFSPLRPCCPDDTGAPRAGWAGGPHAPLGCVVTGIDDGAKEEQAALALARTLRSQGLSVAVMTPAVRGEPQARGRWASPLLQRLAAAGSFRLPESALCPYRLPPASDLAAAAMLAGLRIEPEVVVDALDVLSTWVDALVVMGVGGLRSPLGPQLQAGQLFAHLALPLVLVRGRDTPEGAADLPGLRVAGWLERDAGPAPRLDAADGMDPRRPRLGSVGAVAPAPLLQALRAPALKVPSADGRPRP